MGAGPYILGIDLGTGGPKVSVVGADGELAGSAVRPVKTLALPDGGFEQDPEEIWAAIVAAVREALHAAGHPREAVVGVTCCSQYSSIVPIDERGHPVGNLLPWMDGRGGAHTQKLYGAHPDALLRWVDIAGMPPLPWGSDSLSHMLFLQQERPEVYARAHKLVEPMDFVTARLSGVCAANACTAFTQLLTDIRDLSAVRYSDELLALSGIDRAKLPELVPVGSCLGTLADDVSQELGLAPATRVFSGVNDTQAASIGAGVFRPGSGGLSIGTTCQVLGSVPDKRADLEHSILSMPSPIAGQYLVMAENGLGGRTLEHFLGSLVFARDALADHSTGDPYARVEATLRGVPAGSGGLLYLPWLGGALSPVAAPAMRGGFLNLSLETGRAHMLRAVVEGVAYSLRWLLPAVETLAGERFAELRFAGGGALSDAWSQTLADVMDRPVHQLADARHVNTRATASLAFEQLGLASLDAIGRLCPVARTYEPTPAHREVYARLFEQFVASFEGLRPVFEALNG